MRYLLIFQLFSLSAFQLFAAQRPNVLLVLADDLGYSDLSCYGSEIQTPNLDRLAAGGTRFSAFYTSARCCPSRASLMTGLHPHQTGIGSFATARPRENSSPAYTGHLLPTCATLAEMLGDAGYSTWMVGKWHMGTPGPVERGFQNYYGYKNFLAHSESQWDPALYTRLPEGTRPELQNPDPFYVTDVFTDYALEFLRQARSPNPEDRTSNIEPRTSQKPWFLYLAHSSPHFPVQAPKASIDKHMDTYRRGWDALRAERFERQKKLGIVPDNATLPPRSEVPVDRDDIANGFSGKPNPAWDTLPADRREDLARRMATFAAMVEHVDTGIGKIIADLEKNGELDNTLIAFLSDNGACYEWGPFGFDGPSRKGLTNLHTGAGLDNFGQHGTHSSYGSGWANLGNTPLNMYKHFCHEGGIASPLILHWPAGVKRANTWSHTPAHLMDIVPTVLEATGATYPEKRGAHTITPVEGTSLLANFAGGAIIPARPIPFEHQLARSLRFGDWKIVWGKRQPVEPTWELFNLKDDRSEQTDLSGSEPEIRGQLIGKWNTWAKRVGADPFAQPSTAQPDSPDIANLDLTLTATVARQGDTTPHGVVFAQGGREHGVALHFVGGHPALDLRVDGKVTRLQHPDIPTTKRIRLEATVTAAKLTLTANGKTVTAGSPGLLPVTPKDPLTVGEDSLTAAGDYPDGNPLRNATVVKHALTPAPPSTTPSHGKLVIPDAIVAPVPPVMSRAEIEAGLKSHDRALFIKNDWIRDPYITLGPDDHYYLTGTTIDEDDPREQTDPYNIGLGDQSAVGTTVRVWKSRDLVDWQYLGTPFTLADSAHQQPGDRLWAPEIHWIPEMNRWALVHCPKQKSNLALSAGPGLKGPWTHPMGKDNIPRKHDPSLFKAGDTYWMLSENTNVQPLSNNFTKFTAPPTRIDPSGTRPGPDGHPISQIGHEGATMLKFGNKFVHLGTAWSTDRIRQGSYNLYYSTADNITGPYGPRKFAGRFLGHGTPFQTRDGNWWCTAFFNANVPPLTKQGIQQRDLSETAQTINQRGTTIVPLDVSILPSGEVHIQAKDPHYATPGPDESQPFP